ncbi:MAG: type II secretion system protein [Candidatus Omnitrophota bacterium]
MIINKIKYFKKSTSKKAFTLIELIVAVSILSIGLVLIMRSLLSVVTALDTGSNDIYAVELLDEQMSDLELQTIISPQKAIEPASEDVAVGNRPASLNRDVYHLDDDQWGEGENPSQTIDKVEMTLLWKQDERERKVFLETYFIKEAE